MQSHVAVASSRFEARTDADRRSLFGVVIRDGMLVTALGLLAGLAVAAAGARVMRNLLFNIAPLDPVAFAVAPLILAMVGLIACIVPARRAARADLCGSLRAE